MTISTVTLHFDQFGDPAAPPLVILHGFFASSRNWRQIARFLASHYCVYVLDLRNHGSSPHHENMGYPDMVRDVIAFLDAHGLDQVVLLGHSMGGKVVMWLALKHPERIQQVIVADIAPVRYRHHFKAVINALKSLPLKQIKNRKQAEDFLADSIPELSFRQFHLQNLDLLDGEFQWKIDLDIFEHNAMLIAAFPDLGSIKPYANRALFITGADSSYVLPDYKKQVEALFPWAKFCQIPNASHWLHAQQPGLFIQAIEKYLAETEGLA